MRRKGELSGAAIDRGWPHQVALAARLCERDGYNEMHQFCRHLTLCSRGHALYHDRQWFHVYSREIKTEPHRCDNLSGFVAGCMPAPGGKLRVKPRARRAPSKCTR